MFQPYADLLNAIIVIFAIGILAGLLYLCKLTKANGFVWKAAAFGWVALVRILLVAHIEPFVKYSAQVTLPFYLLFAVGAYLTIVKLLSVYRNGVDHAREHVTAEKAAEMVKLAEKAAHAAADSATIAMEAAQRAELMAQQSRAASTSANRATEISRE
jgi:hypothetical protein